MDAHKTPQDLIDGYLQGTLGNSDQATFDSLFASDPAFSEKVTGALASHLGEAPSDFVDSVASHLDNRWESIYQKGTRTASHSSFLEAGVLVAALAVMVGAGWYVWKVLGDTSLEACQTLADNPKVVLAFTLPTSEKTSWKPKMTFADAERDFAAQTSPDRVVTTSSRVSDESRENESLEPLVGQILRIRVEVPRDLKGRVTLWDSEGRLVRHLFDGSMPKGTWALDWDQKDDRGSLVHPGSYSVHIEAAGQLLTGQVVVAPGS